MGSSKFIKDISKEFSLYSCKHRGIPDITDGLKDVQRKMLWMMRNRSDKIKTVSLAGAAIEENIYVHGDAAASESISQLAAPYKNNVPLLKGEGNFGTRIGPDSWASPRYTYVKKNNITEQLVYPDLNIIPMMDNYDQSTQEPKHFLPLIPLVLLNGISGIAVGWSTDIMPHNFYEIVNQCLKELKGEKLQNISPSFDYLNCVIENINDSEFYISGIVEIIDSSTCIVTELSPYLSVEKFKEKLNSLEDDGTINEYKDNSTETINIEIKFPRGHLKDKTTEYLIDILKLKQKKSERIVTISFDGESVITFNNTSEVIKEFVEWRMTWFKKRYEKLVSDDQYELDYYLALKECILAKLPDNLKKLNSRAEVIDKINYITKNKLDDNRINRIMNIPLYKWTTDFINEVNKKISDLEDKIKNNTKILNSDKELKKIYIKELEQLKKLKV